MKRAMCHFMQFDHITVTYIRREPDRWMYKRGSVACAIMCRSDGYYATKIHWVVTTRPSKQMDMSQHEQHM